MLLMTGGAYVLHGSSLSRRPVRNAVLGLTLWVFYLIQPVVDLAPMKRLGKELDLQLGYPFQHLPGNGTRRYEGDVGTFASFLPQGFNKFHPIYIRHLVVRYNDNVARLSHLALAIFRIQRTFLGFGKRCNFITPAMEDVSQQASHRCVIIYYHGFHVNDLLSHGKFTSVIRVSSTDSRQPSC